jgi:hypothetical protein
MEEDILDIKRENYKLRKENFELIQDNTKLQEEIKLLNYKLREEICAEATRRMKCVELYYIPKQTIRDKIKEYEEQKTTFSMLNIDCIKKYQGIKVLKELLGDE